MSVEIISENDCELIPSNVPKLTKFQRCLAICVRIRDRKIFAMAYGFFVLSLGVVLMVGYLGIRSITTSTVHIETPIPTMASSAMTIISGILFSALVFYKPRYLIIAMVLISTISGIISAVGALHYGTFVSEHMTALSDCLYTTVQRSCTCVIDSPTSRVSYKFENTASCDQITIHLREVVYGICGVYAVSFMACFGTALYGILLLHRIEIRKIKAEKTKFGIIKRPLKEKSGFEEHSPDTIPEAKTKSVTPWQQDVATQTGESSTGNELNCRQQCRHQCRHFVEVTVPDATNDYVVNITKSRDPPPPYCETVYT